MRTPTRDDATDAVLAGGRATPMGGFDKGLVQLQSSTLVDRALERLQPQVASALISANCNLDRYRDLGFPVWLDADAGSEPFPGPLAGMLAGLRACCPMRPDG